MSNSMTKNVNLPSLFTCDALTEIIAHSAKEILAAAVQAEAAQWIAERSNLRDQHGHRVTGRFRTSHRRAQFRGSKPATEFSPYNA